MNVEVRHTEIGIKSKRACIFAKQYITRAEMKGTVHVGVISPQSEMIPSTE